MTKAANLRYSVPSCRGIHNSKLIHWYISHCCIHQTPYFYSMDSLTQIALGVAVAEVCAGKRLRNRTFLYGAVLGTIPDLDVFVGKFMSPVDSVLIHRGLSHSILFFLLLSPFVGKLISNIEKGKISFRQASTMVFWCLFTHVLLDAFTTWGTQILWPLPYRFALKTIFVIDPLYTIPLLLSLIWVWKTKEYGLRRKYVIRGLIVSSGYLLVSAGIKLYALNQFQKALSDQSIAYHEIIVKPSAFNTILWNANVETEEAYLLGDYSLFDTQPISFRRYPKNKQLEKEVAEVEDFHKLKKISEGWYLMTEKEGTIYFNDLRFGLLNDNPAYPQFAFSYAFVSDNGLTYAEEVPRTNRDGKALLKGILERIGGN